MKNLYRSNVELEKYVDEGEEDKVRYCEHCEKYGFKVKPGTKILQNGEQKAPDCDQFLSTMIVVTPFRSKRPNLKVK